MNTFYMSGEIKYSLSALHYFTLRLKCTLLFLRQYTINTNSYSYVLYEFTINSKVILHHDSDQDEAATEDD